MFTNALSVKLRQEPRRAFTEDNAFHQFIVTSYGRGGGVGRGLGGGLDLGVGVGLGVGVAVALPWPWESLWP